MIHDSRTQSIRHCHGRQYALTLTVLLPGLDDEHINGFLCRRQFKPQVLHQRLLESVRLCFIPGQIHVEVARQPGLVHDRNVKLVFQRRGQTGERLINARELTRTRAGRTALKLTRPQTIRPRVLYGQAQDIGFTGLMARTQSKLSF